MQRIDFLVVGSKGDEYHVTFEREGDNMNAYCDCPAGDNGLYCKHRFALMEGDAKAVLSSNKADAARLADMMAGTDLEAAYKACQATERAHHASAKKLRAVRVALAKAMRQ